MYKYEIADLLTSHHSATCPQRASSPQHYSPSAAAWFSTDGTSSARGHGNNGESPFTTPYTPNPTTNHFHHTPILFLLWQYNSLAWPGTSKDRPSLTQALVGKCPRELAREKMWARIHLIPALQAEEDRDQVRRYLADQQRERDLMGGDNFKVYNNSERFVKPTFAVTPEKSK